MLNRKFDSVWRFLRENNCDDAADNITNGMRCTICGNVMINAHIGGCGCRFCLGCVTDNLNGGSRYCPGNGVDCKQELLEVGETVHPDHAMNQEISRLTVKCPRDWCEFTGQLAKMEEHERECDNRAAKCPYGEIGCPLSRLARDKIDGHLERENESHARLLMDCMGRLQNEIGRLELGRREQQAVAEKQAGQIEQLQHENRSMKEQIISLQAADETQREEFAVLMAASSNQISELQAETERLREKCLLLEGKSGEFERQVANETEGRWRDADVIREVQTRCDDVAIRGRENWLHVVNIRHGEFIWCIDQWAARRQAALDDVNNDEKRILYSNVFYISLHRAWMMLILCFENGVIDIDKLIVGWSLIPGPFDDNKYKKWPFKGDVIVSVIDQQTRLDHVSFTVKHDQYPGDVRWDKPKDIPNDPFTNVENPFDLDEISRNPAVCRDDRIFIRCVVEMHIK